MLRDYEIELLAEDIADVMGKTELVRPGFNGVRNDLTSEIIRHLNTGDITEFKLFFREYIPSDAKQDNTIKSILQRLNQHAAVFVAIESTSDYSDKDFRAERTNTLRGVMVRDKFRIVCIDGSENLAPINDRVFNTREEASDFIYNNPQYEQISYEDLIDMIPTESLSFPDAYGIDLTAKKEGSIHI